MHKQLLNELVIDFVISPKGPLLIKASETGADPTLPDMEFVRADSPQGRTVYLPGSSLKGAIRAHSEKIARTLDEYPAPVPLSCNPVADGSKPGRDDYACGKRWDQMKDEQPSTSRIYRESCFLCRMFGNTSLASHVRLADAYPNPEKVVVTEERNGVAIDRVFGSVAVGPFNYEAVLQGEFAGTLYMKNFTVAQVGLLALTLRDLREQRLRIGFAKSRGLGQVDFRIRSLLLRYPTAGLAHAELVPNGQLTGVGKFPNLREYGFPADDAAAVEGLAFQENDWGERSALVEQPEMLDRIWKRGVEAWAREVRQHNANKA